MTSRLSFDGKPVRALRILAEAGTPLHEDEVYWQAHRQHGSDYPYFNALRKLVTLGFATRHGKRGGYRYLITPEGRAFLASKEPVR